MGNDGLRQEPDNFLTEKIGREGMQEESKVRAKYYKNYLIIIKSSGLVLLSDSIFI